MPKDTTPTYIHQFPLRTCPWQVRKLMIRMNALRDLYNGIMGEGFKRLNKLRKDPKHQQCIKEYKALMNELKPLERKHNALISIQQDKATSASLKALEKQMRPLLTQKKSLQRRFSELDKKHGFTQYALQPFATAMKNKSYMKHHLDGDTVQVISDRVFQALNAYRYGQKGRPRFKSSQKGLRSISGKANRCLRFTDKGKFSWNGLVLDVIYDTKDKHLVQQHALNSEKKYVRLIHRQHKGKNTFYMQLVLKGEPLKKANYPIGQGKTVGLDLGVSTLAAVSKDKALLTPFVVELDNLQQDIQRLQRKASRKLRLLNPDNYNEQGAIIKGRKTWQKSNHYHKLQQDIRSLYETMRHKRTHLHYQLVKNVLAMGNHLHIEKNNYKAWQKGLYGKTIGFRAPSQFETLLTRKALQTGGQVTFIDARKAKLSQYNHVSDTYTKKTLNDRIQVLDDNTIVQRDLYSAALAYSFDVKKNQVDRIRLEKEWKSLDTGFKWALATLYDQYTNSRNKDLFPSCLRHKDVLELERIAYESLFDTSQ
jgi:hypothetical protein